MHACVFNTSEETRTATKCSRWKWQLVNMEVGVRSPIVSISLLVKNVFFGSMVDK